MSPSRHKERLLTSTKVRELKGQEVMIMSEGFDEILADSSLGVRNLATRTRALIRDVSRTWLRSCGRDRASWATASGRGRCRNTSLHRLPQIHVNLTSNYGSELFDPGSFFQSCKQNPAAFPRGFARWSGR
jgi:hypothetical protein